MFTFLKRSEVTDSTITVESGSGATVNGGNLSNVYDGDKNTKFIASGYNVDDSLGKSILFIITRGTNTSMPWYSMILNHNIKKFSVATFNGASLVTTGYIVDNAASNLCIYIPSTTSNKLYLMLRSTMIPNEEKYLHELIVSSEVLAQFNPPSNQNFNQSIRHIGFQKQVGDGGFVSRRFSTKYASEMSLTNVNSTTYQDLRDVWESNRNFIFVPNLTSTTFISGTITASSLWDGNIHNVVWSGDFNSSYSQNSLSQGYNIDIKLNQITG